MEVEHKTGLGRRLLWGIGLACLLIAIAAAVLLFIRHTATPVPKQVRQAFKTVIFVPSGTGVAVNRDSMAVTRPDGAQDGVLNFSGTVDGQALNFGEQPTPQQFTDIPKTYELVVNQSKPYDSFESTVGTVQLTRPQAKQVAMLNEKGTYVIVEAGKDLTKDQWRRVFDGMVLVK